MKILIDEKELDQCVGGCAAFGQALSQAAQNTFGPGVGGVAGLYDPSHGVQGNNIKQFKAANC